MTSTDFTELLQGFFLKWLAEGKNLSPNTICAYRDSFALFLRWADTNLHVHADKMTMADFTADNVSAFLEHLATVRGNSARTVNARLAAIHSFSQYALHKDPIRIDDLRRVLEIPQRKTHIAEVDYLTGDEIAQILEVCDKDRVAGRTAHLLIALLFNTGARISEIVILKVCDIEISGAHARIHLTGKGRKQRCLPLWSQTIVEITAYLDRSHLSGGDYLFPGRNVAHLTRSGARSQLDAAVAKASNLNPQLAAKQISPHTFRHSTAMAMLQAGVDLSTIAIWLGHENIQTTHKYMVADMALKQAAIAKVHPSTLAGSNWPQPSKGVLAFLESL